MLVKYWLVQILVIVVHLSFTKLLLTLSDVFTPVQLYNSTMNEPINVWYNDGSIINGEDDHFVLMRVTSVIVGIFLIPYMLIILIYSTNLMLVNVVGLQDIV